MKPNILIRPIITEKITGLQEKKNQYAFEVEINANKVDIADAIEKKFNVKVISIRTVRIKGKRRSQFTRRGKFEGFKSSRKKAIVTLDKDNKIDLFETA